MTVRTLQEVQAGRITVTVTIDETAATTPTERLYTADEVAHYQSTEGKLIEDARRAEVNELTTHLGAARKTIEALKRQVIEYNHDRRSERDRADQNKAWAERTEAELVTREEKYLAVKAELVTARQETEALQHRVREQSRLVTTERDQNEDVLDKVRRERNATVDKLAVVRSRVWTDAVVQALAASADPADHAAVLAEAVRDVREIVHTSRA